MSFFSSLANYQQITGKLNLFSIIADYQCVSKNVNTFLNVFSKLLANYRQIKLSPYRYIPHISFRRIRIQCFNPSLRYCLLYQS